jgi:hypothetical protein
MQAVDMYSILINLKFSSECVCMLNKSSGGESYTYKCIGSIICAGMWNGYHKCPRSHPSSPQLSSGERIMSSWRRIPVCAVETHSDYTSKHKSASPWIQSGTLIIDVSSEYYRDLS